jgi:hypothetical protein
MNSATHSEAAIMLQMNQGNDERKERKKRRKKTNEKKNTPTPNNTKS